MQTRQLQLRKPLRKPQGQILTVLTSNPASQKSQSSLIRVGGLLDPQEETNLQGHTPDSIVREVRHSMTKAVSNPILLKAGRWSVHPRSKGNFVFSFDGNIPFEHILSYEHILLAPFKGYGQLCPSLGWTRLLVHSVPFQDNDGIVFGLGALHLEVQTLPGLRKAYFAMHPRWLKLPQEINAKYTSVTFAVSDLDGSITSRLMQSRMAMFGKEVKVEKWVDKPALIQCSRCHVLGHNKSSKACAYGTNLVRCFKCGGAHKSEEHNQKCPCKHAVAGVCDCKHLRCLNCQGTDHHCRDTKCPARKLY